MNRFLPLLALTALSNCTSLVPHTPLPPDPRYGTRVLEYSPLQPLNSYFEHHGTSVTMVAYQSAGFDLDYKSVDAAWLSKRFSLPDFKTTDLPLPPIALTKDFRMALPVGDADVDAVLSQQGELAIREGQTWTKHAYPELLAGDIEFLVVTGPTSLLLQTGRGVWALRNETWEQLAPDLGNRTYLVAVDGDRVRLVSGAPIDPSTMMPTGQAVISLVSYATGARLAPDEIPKDRFTGLAMAGMNGTVDDFFLYLGEDGVRNDVIRTIHYRHGVFERLRRNELPYDNGYASIYPTPGSTTVQFRGQLNSDAVFNWPPCGCDIRKDTACLCRDRSVLRTVLPAPDGLHGVGIVTAIEEGRAHLALTLLDLSKKIDPLSLIRPEACSPQCQEPLVCMDKQGAFSCGMRPEVPDGGWVQPGDLPVTLTAHLVTPPGIDAGSFDVVTEKYMLYLPYPDFDVIEYGPNLKVAVEANVAGRLTLFERQTGLNAYRDFSPTPAGTTVDLGEIRFGAPVLSFATGAIQLEILNIDPATGFMLANVNGHLSYLEQTPGFFRFRDTKISNPTSIRYFPYGGVAFVTSAAGTSYIPNGQEDGGVAPPMVAQSGTYDFSKVAISSEALTWVVPRVTSQGATQNPATWFDIGGQRQISEAGEADALSADGIVLIRREGNELVRRSRHTNGRTVFINDLSGPAAFLVPNDNGNELTYDPAVVIVEGATPQACVAGSGSATCSVRLRPAGANFTTPISSTARFVAISRDGKAILFDEGQGPTRYDVNATTRAAVPLPSGFVVSDVQQVGDTTELFAVDGRIVVYDLKTGTVLRTIPAAARMKRSPGGAIIQADACGNGEPCAVQSYFPVDDRLTNFGPGSAHRTILSGGESVSLQNDTLSVLSLTPGIEPRVAMPPGYHTVLLPGFDDALATFGARCAFFTADAEFGGSTRFTGCAY